MWGDLVLADAARVSREPLLGFSGDNPFNPSEYWEACLIWAGAEHTDPADAGGAGAGGAGSADRKSTV